jgi:dipeptide/tripeptide permease
MPLHDVLRLVSAGILAAMGLLLARDNVSLITTQDAGLGLFLLGVGYGLLLVKRHFDRTLP